MRLTGAVEVGDGQQQEAEVSVALSLFDPPAQAAPVLKWAGGKRQLLPDIEKRLPSRWGAYHEPFVGGGAVFFELGNRGLLTGGAVLSDGNARLINLYTCLRDNVDAVVRHLANLATDSTEPAYYRARTEFNAGGELSRMAALFIYLNRTGFNGLYRVNGRGDFNGPWGKEERPPEQIVREPVLRAASFALREVEIHHRDFAVALRQPIAGDFIYMDPPYWPASATSNFTTYAGAFGPTQQRALAQACRDIDRRGVQWMASNADVQPVRDLYAGFRIETVSARRAINSDASKRGAVGELLIRNY